ncbi:alpha-amylase family protein [Propionibacterium australiense]|uniref:Glycoside hydrolase superfamily n=1 Tax=Propionibacterium australiense TaxID=119981 RepID=A0A383S8Z4_9ACTN|nr:alpha-amylase family protein [Propionibacterium australiense]RLP06292.1 alpha-amylase [Propionibacterium australiense]SYZ34495.1 Glycoside hydrolase superfamily [Propionibacterium australiense]VEH88993.1 Neopullulanase [Propionibacterium australiense]
MTSWSDDTIWWAVYPLGFLGASTRPATGRRPLEHRLPALEGWLDYLLSIGCNGLALGPIFESVSHGYDTLDYFRVDPRLGDADDLAHLVQACHARGIHVALDGVFNHVSAAYPDLLAALDGGPQAPTADMFHIDWSTTPPTRLNFEGSDDLVRLNHESAAVRELVTRVMNHWLEFGVDAWRLDAAYAVPPAFWAPVLADVRAAHPQVFVWGEVIHGDYAQIVADSTMDSLTEYELWKATWSSLADENFYELDWTLGRHNEFCESFTPLTFLGNHDTTRIASKVGGAKAVLAATVLFTVGGTPSIYYGDEQGFHGIKYDRAWGDDEVRPAVPADPQELSALGAGTLRCYQQLISVRRRNPWLVRARTTVTQLANDRISYEACDRADETRRLYVTLSVGETATARIVDDEGELFAFEG